MSDYNLPITRHLVIHDKEAYAQAIDFLQDHDIPYVDSIHRCLDSLMTGHYYEADEVHIAKDGCPHSFNFWFEKNHQRIGFNGGIICHGIGETFAVVLDSSSHGKIFWSTHT